MNPIHPRFAPLAVMASLLAFACPPSPAHAQGLYGELARTTALSAADEYRIGKGYIDMAVCFGGGELKDPALVVPIEALLRRLVAASDRPDLVWNLTLVDSPEINAAALPGGFVLVNRGLIEALSEEQLAFVLAHEISHVLLRHFATANNMNSALGVLEVAEGAQASDSQDEAMKRLEEMSLMLTAYQRNLELESDLFGLLYAVRAGYPASAAVSSMEAMRERVGELPANLQAQSTHPSFSDRISELQKGAQTLVETANFFDAGVAYCRSQAWDAGVNAFQQFLTLFPRSAAGWSNLGTCHLRKALLTFPADPWHEDLPLYASSGMQLRAGVDTVSLERARHALGKAIEIDPTRDAALANLAVMARHEGDIEGAEKLLARAMELDADYAGYSNNLGVLRASQKQWKKAERAFGKAEKADPKLLLVKANRAAMAAERGKKKDAIALWRELEGAAGLRAAAYDALLALGEQPSQPREPVAVAAATGQDEQSLLVLLTEALEDAAEAPGGASGEDARIGSVKLGMSLKAVTELLGDADFVDGYDDSFYGYGIWSAQGFAAVFVDDAANSFEVSPPSASKTGRGLALGATKQQVGSAYGEMDFGFDDEDSGGSVMIYERLGHGFYFDAEGLLNGFSIWTD